MRFIKKGNNFFFLPAATYKYLSVKTLYYLNMASRIYVGNLSQYLFKMLIAVDSLV